MTSIAETRADNLLDLMLLEYAAGTLAYAPSLVVAAHLAMQERARADVALYETLGGLFLTDTNDTAPVGKKCIDKVMEHIASVSPCAGKKDADCLDTAALLPESLSLPPQVRVLLSKACRQRSGCWSALSKGVDIYDLPFPDTNNHPYKMRLMRLAPALATPAHTHSGIEMTLVLNGSFEDETGAYGIGDLIVVRDTPRSHHPRACPQNGCICLTLTEAPLRFDNPVRRFLNIFWKI